MAETTGFAAVFMDEERLLDAVKSLIERDTFAVLAVLTREGDVVLRPIGGRWGAGIRDAAQEMAEKYPGCKMRLFEQECNYEKYFKGIVAQDQVLPYADFSPETKAAIEEVRRKVLGRSRQETG